MSAADAARWTAVTTRDRAADGDFVYAVATTGVYCRPSCGARTPRRENVSFHPDPAAAAAAGFRACLRCRPGEPALDAQRVAAAVQAIAAAEHAPPLTQLAAAAGVTPAHFQRLFKRATGLSPRGYAAARRAAQLREALGETERVVDAAYGAGYGSASRFYAAAGDALGMAPARYRAGGAAETIRYAVAGCSLGQVLVAATARGVCAILLGDDPAALIADLRRRFGRAELSEDDAAFAATVTQVIALIEAPGRGLDLPLDVRGTLFQQQVWEALRRIPAGTTATYAEVAVAIDAPAAVRAVAGACAANALAVAIPCHRVVRTGGGLSGYRWGGERKRALLAREAGET